MRGVFHASQAQHSRRSASVGSMLTGNPVRLRLRQTDPFPQHVHSSASPRRDHQLRLAVPVRMSISSSSNRLASLASKLLFWCRHHRSRCVGHLEVQSHYSPISTRRQQSACVLRVRTIVYAFCRSGQPNFASSQILNPPRNLVTYELVL